MFSASDETEEFEDMKGERPCDAELEVEGKEEAGGGNCCVVVVLSCCCSV